jgi:hypothetical protein
VAVAVTLSAQGVDFSLQGGALFQDRLERLCSDPPGKFVPVSAKRCTSSGNALGEGKEFGLGRLKGPSVRSGDSRDKIDAV